MSEPDVDALVRGHLTREAAKVDPAAVLAGVRSRLAARPPAPRRVAPRRRLGWTLAAAAAVAAVLFSGRFLSPPAAQASPEGLVWGARQAHSLPIDRSYRVQVVAAPDGPLGLFPHLAQQRQMRLWTRGDRFWIESSSADRSWALGRDEHGSLWLADGRRQGLRYERDEVPELVGLACDVCGLRVETLLDEVLAGCDLHTEPGGTPGTRRIRAEPRPGQAGAGLRAATLDIDEQSRVLRRLEWQRTRRGHLLATVTFTLEETRSQDLALYQLEGHLDPGAPVFDRQHRPRQRALTLWRLFGVPLLQGKS